MRIIGTAGAGRKRPDISLEAEWEALVREMLN